MKFTLVTVLPLMLGISVGCTRTVNVTKQMTWQCAPEEYRPAFPASPDEYVRFRFVEEPRCFDLESAPDLCAQLRSMGKAVVSVEFQVWGGLGPLHRESYNMVAVERQPLANKGGWASAGANDVRGKCPIDKVIDGLPFKSSK